MRFLPFDFRPFPFALRFRPLGFTCTRGNARLSAAPMVDMSPPSVMDLSAIRVRSFSAFSSSFNVREGVPGPGSQRA